LLFGFLSKYDLLWKYSKSIVLAAVGSITALSFKLRI
jgi:hypothetical protein